MKQKMDKKSIEALMEYRIHRAEETLLEAEVLVKNGFYNAAVNRLYYSCYYAAIALLIKHQILTHSHSGVKQMLGIHFILTGKLDTKWGRFYTQLFNDRITGDYDDFIAYDKDAIDEILPKSTEFIQMIKGLLETGTGNDLQ